MWYDLPLTKVNFFIRYDSWTWRVSAFQRQYPSSMNGLGKTEKWSVNYDVWIHDDLRAQDDYCVTERHCGVGGLASDLEGCEWQCWNKVMVTALAEHRISVTYISLTYLNQFSTDKYPSGWQPAWRLPINTMQVSKVHLSQIRWYDDNICRQNSLRSSSTKIHGREGTSLCLLRRPSAANVQRVCMVSLGITGEDKWRKQAARWRWRSELLVSVISTAAAGAVELISVVTRARVTAWSIVTRLGVSSTRARHLSTLVHICITHTHTHTLSLSLSLSLSHSLTHCDLDYNRYVS